MTEQEAIETIEKAIEYSEKSLAELDTTKKWSENNGKLGEYYSIRENVVKEIDASKIAIKALEEIQKYKSLGTVEELRIAKEKQIAKKPHKNFEKFGGVWCSCGKYLGKGYFVDKPSYCPNCGQKLDWSDAD